MSGAEAQPHVVGAPDTTEQVMALVGDMLARKGRPPVGPTDSLRDAGLSSLDLVNLMLLVEETFDLMLPESRMTPDNFSSIASIDTMIGELRRA